MSLKSKAKAEKARQKAKAQKEAEAQKLLDNALRLKTMVSGFARTERRTQHTEAHKAAAMPQYVRQREVQHVEDRWTMGPQRKATRKEIDDEMIRRDAEARLHYEHNMKPRIGPAFNKSGDMYLSETELAAERKGELRRRS